MVEFYRFKLYFDKDYGKKFEIFFKGNFKRLIEFVVNIFFFFLEVINKKYIFKGDLDLILKLKRDELFCKKIEDEKFYIFIWKKKLKYLVLIFVYGIDGVEYFEKIFFILKIIEIKIKENNI